MDMRIEAAPMEAAVVMTVVSVVAQKVKSFKAFALIERVASFSCPSIAGTSLSAVSPDYNFIGGTALAAA